MAPLRTLLLALPCLAAGADELTLTHAPAAGASQRVELEVVETTTGGDLTVFMNGSPVPPMYLPTLELEVRNVRKLDYTQTWEAFAPDGASSWLRRYDVASWSNNGSMTMTQMGQSEVTPWEMEQEAALTGEIVQFWTSDAETEPSARVLSDEDIELPEDLMASLGLGHLVPNEAVETGHRWSVDGETLAQLWEPGGNLGWNLPAESAARLMPEYDERTLAGELELTLEAIESDDDRQLAICRVEGELERTSIKPGDLSQVPVASGTATDTLRETLELEGTLRWNLATRQIASLELSGTLASATKTVKDEGQEGPAYYSVFSFDGEYELTLKATPVEDNALSAE